MKLLSNIAKNTSALLLATLTRMMASFVLMLIIARHLGAEGMGTFGIVIALFWFFAKIAPAGLEPLIVREVSKNKTKANAYLVNGSLIALVSSVIMVFVMAGFVNIIGYSREIVLSVYIISLALILTTINGILRSIFIAFDRSDYVLYGSLTENSVKLVFGLLILILGYGIPTLILIVSISTVVYFVLSLWLIQKKLIRLKPQFDGALCKSILKILPTFTGMQVFTAFSGDLTVIILSVMMSVEEVGLYSAAIRLVNMFLMVIQSYRLAIQPTAVRTFEASLDSLRRFCIKSLKYVLLLTIPVSIGMMILAPRVIVLFFSEKFLSSSPLVRILIWTLPINGLSFVFTSILIASNHQKTNLRAVAVSTALRIALAFLLIPYFSYFGAAVAVLLGDLSNFVQKYIFILKRLFRFRFDEILKNTAVATAVMAVFLIVFHKLNLFLIVGCAIIVFFVMLFALGEWTLQDVSLLKMVSIKRK